MNELDRIAVHRDMEVRSAAADGRSTDRPPLVSIAVPCFNGEGYVGDAIASALGQTYPDIEIIVVDDASTDGSPEVIRAAAALDCRLRPIFLEENGGPAAARNAALAAARGEWITLLDADDLYRPDRIERLLALARLTGADLVVDNQHVHDFPDGGDAALAFDFLRGSLPVPISQDLFFERSSVFGSMNPGYLKPMFRREFLVREGLSYRREHRVGEDFYLYAECLCREASFYGIDYAGYIYRRRETSLTRSGGWPLRQLAAMSDEILAEYGQRLTPVARTALERRRRVLNRYARLADIRASDDGGLLRASMRVAASPDLLLLLPGILRRKLAGA